MCGTRTGYNAHYKRKEKPCAACKLAQREYYIQWRKKNPEIVKAMVLKDRTIHKERYLKTLYAWDKAHPEKVKERQKKYKQNNSENSRKHARIRIARKLQNGAEPYSEAQILEKYKNICQWCKKEIDLTAPRTAGGGKNWENGLQIDHIIPVSKGGPDKLDNVQPLHVYCNLKKGNRPSQQ